MGYRLLTLSPQPLSYILHQPSNIFPFTLTLMLKKVFLVFPRMMSLVAKQRMMRAGLVQEISLKHKDMTSAWKSIAIRHQQRGFQGFGLNMKQYVWHRNLPVSQNSFSHFPRNSQNLFSYLSRNPHNLGHTVIPMIYLHNLTHRHDISRMHASTYRPTSHPAHDDGNDPSIPVVASGDWVFLRLSIQ